MSITELPHTRGCVVCGHDNRHGLHLHLNVDEPSGVVTAEYVPRPEHIGFEGIIHGGILSTVLDEAMVWCATWAGKRFCVAGEMNVRFRRSATVGQKLTIEARIGSLRSRMIETEAFIRDEPGNVIAEATGKYVPLPPPRNRDVVATLVEEPSTVHTLDALKRAAGAV
jgi:uncharacterized protein (TIGR00369 family)